MCDHDLPRDVKAEPGVLPEILLRPVGVEALEDALEIFLGNARALVLDGDLDFGTDPPRHHRYAPARRRERDRIVEQIDDDLAQAAVMAGDAVGPRAGRI